MQPVLYKKIKFSIKDFFRKCDHIRRKLLIWSHLLKKSLMENSIFCAVQISSKNFCTVGTYLLKVNNKNTTTRCEICSKLTIKIPCSSVSIVNFEHAVTRCNFQCVYIEYLITCPSNRKFMIIKRPLEYIFFGKIFPKRILLFVFLNIPTSW